MNKTTKLRIGILGDRAVGKTTYLTTLHGLLANHKYDNIEVRYQDIQTVKYLKSNFQKLLSEGIVDATVGEYDITFDLWIEKEKNKKNHFLIEMRDFAGEKTRVENNETESVIDFLATCDAILYLYSIPDKLDDSVGTQDLFDVNIILTQLTNRQEGLKKLDKPFVLLLSKCDEITRRDNTEVSSVEELNAIIKDRVLEECDYLVSELKRFSNNFKVVAISSFFALHHYKKNKSTKMWSYPSTNDMIEFPIVDVAYPITFILSKNIKVDFWDSMLGLFK